MAAQKQNGYTKHTDTNKIWSYTTGKQEWDYTITQPNDKIQLS